MNEEGLPSNGGTLPSHLPFPVVGLGGSAGGINALLRFFENMPAQSGMAFVVVLHLSPKHKSNVAHILQNVTRIPVAQVTESVPIEPDRVYVIPPTHMLSMNDSYLKLDQIKRPIGRHIAIDIFFRTLGDTHRERAMAVILSGMGTDGAVGLSRVKEQGGITITQSPADAEYDSMPCSAIETGKVDFVIPVAEIPQKLLEIWENARKIRMPQPEAPPPMQVRSLESPEEMRAAEDALQEILVILRTRTGHDFRHYKRATLLRRIERRLQVRRLTDIPSYRNYLRENKDETAALLKDLLISVTNFFRDREAFDALERDVMPELVARKTAPNDQLRAWVAACATGEEAYSVAMLIREQLDFAKSPADMQIFATEIDDSAIAVGREGAYPESILTDVAPARLRRFFAKENHHYIIKKEIREKILFAEHNILRDPPFSKLDLISCRNLLIYLDRDVHMEIFQILHFALRPGGFLFLGNSETADMASKLFSPVDKKNRIYRANSSQHTGRLIVPRYPLGHAQQRQPAARTAVVSEKRKVSLTDLHQRLLEQYAPPSVLINRQLEIVHLSDRAGRFLNFVGGEPSHKLLSVVHPELRMELRTALFQVMQSNKSIEARRVRIQREDRTFYVNMIARPVHEKGDNDLILVLFDEVEDILGTEGKEPSEAKHEPLVVQLEEELQYTKEQLQNTIEQYETSTEELKVSNEELQAINEELRSTTEELETSKEELQSVNEELITLNHELKLKVDETGQVNNVLQNLIASTDIATIFVDRNMRIKRFTPQAARVFNIIDSDIGRSLLDITHRLDYPGLAADAAETFESLRPIEHEVSSTSGRWYLARLLPYRTVEDRIDGAVLNFIDITSQRQAEEKLRLGEEQMRLVVESTNDYAILTLDEKGIITSWNKGAERIFGWTESEAIGQHTAILFLPEDRPHAPAEEMRKACTEGRAEDERWHIRKDGSAFYCSGVMTLLSNNGARGYAKIARDLTGRKRSEIERETMLKQEKLIRAEAQAANELKDEFLAIMSHELKNPLNLIHVNAELLTRLPEAKSAPAVLRVCEVIKRAVTTQGQIIDDLLDLSRVRTGKMVLSCVPVPLHEMVKSSADVLRAEAASKQLELVFEPAPGEVVVYADPVRVEQVIWNLFSNALKFTPAGGRITVKLAMNEAEAVLDIVDTGIGIEADFLQHIFDMFRQADARTTRQHGGLGIGLALVRHLIDMHGGHINVSSAGPGKGTAFQIRLPLYLKTPALPPSYPESAPSTMAGVRILVVDDDTQAIESLGKLLQLEKAAASTASSADEALRLIETKEFDLIFSDIAMPVVDGYQLLQRLRDQPRTANVPVIAITGYSRPKDVRRILDAGFAGYICKPILIGKLFEIAANVLGKR